MKRIILLLLILISVGIFCQDEKPIKVNKEFKEIKKANEIPDGEANIIALNQYKDGLEVIVKSRKTSPIKVTVKFYDDSYNETPITIYVKPNAIAKNRAMGVNIDNVADVMMDKIENIDFSDNLIDIINTTKKSDCKNKANILDYVEKGDLPGVFCSLSNSVDIETKDTNGITALMRASMNGFIEIVNLLISKGANIETKNKYDATALALASYSGQAKIVKLLLSKGANIEANSGGVTPLMGASWSGHIEVVKLLISNGANINAESSNGATACSKAKTQEIKDLVCK